jgi:hypothetical protein
MKQVSHEEWMNMVKKLNEGQPSLLDLVQKQIDSYEQEKQEKNK